MEMAEADLHSSHYVTSRVPLISRSPRMSRNIPRALTTSESYANMPLGSGHQLAASR